MKINGGQRPITVRSFSFCPRDGRLLKRRSKLEFQKIEEAGGVGGCEEIDMDV